jgi:ABC-type branched-subunit amino acid transport system substrate-binding protein
VAQRAKLIVVACTVWSACGVPAPPSNLINLGALLDRTGANSESSWTQAVGLAQDQVNAAITGDETWHGLQFLISFSDTSNDPRITLKHAKELVDEHQVKGIITDSSQDDIAINATFYDQDTTNDLNLPILCSECTANGINDPTSMDPAAANRDGWNFRAVGNSSSIAYVIVRQLVAQGTNGNGDVNFDRKFKLGVYVSNEAYGQDFAREVKAAAQALEPTRPQAVPISVEVNFHPRDAEPNSYDWRTDLEGLADAAPDGIPDAIIVATFCQYHAAVVRSFKGSYDIQVMHAQNFRVQSAIASLGTLGEGEEGVSPVLVSGMGGNSFTQEFRTATNLDPVFLDAVYYDNAAALMLAALMASKGLSDPTQVTGAAVRDQIAKTSTKGAEVVPAGAEGIKRAVQLIKQGTAFDYDGASGPMDFDAHGNARDRLAHYQAKSGQFVELAQYDCVTDPATCPQQ